MSTLLFGLILPPGVSELIMKNPEYTAAPGSLKFSPLNFPKPKSRSRRPYGSLNDKQRALGGDQRARRRVSGYPETCWICEVSINESERNLANRLKAHWDHDHKTGLFRGWLCSGCNTGLGMFRDNPESLRRAALYLERT
jgi:hypothetical protein